MESGLVIDVLGGLRVRRGGDDVVRLDARSAEALLVYLACERRPFSRDAIAELLWPDRPRDQSRAALRSAVHRLRRVVGPHLIATRDQVGLDAAVTTDFASFETSLRDGRPEDALALYAGPFLDGFTLQGAPAFEAWQTSERARLEGTAIAAHQDRLALAWAQGDAVSALRHAYALLDIDPLHEPTHRSIARLLERDGRTAAALSHLEAFRARLLDELDASPDPTTFELERALRTGHPPDEDQRVAGVHDLGDSGVSVDRSHSLPPIGRRDAEASARHLGTPTFTGALVGRAGAAATIARFLADPDCHWVSVTGAGGVGKTRLALDAAEGTGQWFRHGVVIVPLAGVRSHEFVLPTLAHHIGLQPRPGRELDEQIVSFLQGNHLLLVLDNLEHVLGAVARLAAIVRRAPRVKVLATSRIRLHISEEWLVPLEGLSSDDGADLFERHARRVHADFDLPSNRESVEAICRHVDGLPLALELAAAWVHAVPTPEIARSLAAGSDLLQAPRLDLPPRQRSIEHVLESSWRLLTDDLRETFTHLGVFHGGFTSTEAEAVTGGGIDRLLALVDRSLVHVAQPGRFELHELARRFAAQRLALHPRRDAVARRHLATYADLTAACSRAIFGPGLVTGIARLAEEQDNVRAALQWALSAPAIEPDLLRLLDHVAYFWRLTGAVGEAQTWFNRALERPGWSAIDEATLRFHEGHAAWMRGAFDEAVEALRESVAIWERVAPDDAHVARVRCSLGMSLHMRGEMTAAVAQFDAAHAAAEDRDPWWSACATGWKGKVAAAVGDMEAAQDLLDTAVTAFDRLGSAWGAGLFVGTAAELHLARGDVRRARHLADASITLLEGVGFLHALGNVYALRATIARLDGDERLARTLVQRSIACYRHLGDESSALSTEALLAAPDAG